MNKKAGAGIGIVESKKGKESNKLKGVLGWLAFFILLLFLNSIMSFLYGLIVIFGSGGSLIDVLIGSFQLIIGGLMLTSAILLKKEKKVAVNFTIFTLWTPFFLFILIGMIYWLMGIYAYEEIKTGLLRGFVFALIWTLYLKKSKRVHNTYYSKGSRYDKKEKQIMCPICHKKVYAVDLKAHKREWHGK